MRILGAVGLYRDQGVVLRTYRLGESDRIVVILTQGHGKVRAVAKGVRKTKSRFGARVEPMSHVAVLFFEGRELDIITQAEALEQFRPVREDLDRLTRAHSLLEAADQMVPERQANPRLYQMLVGALRALAAHDAPLLVPAFFLKVLAMEGFHPVLDSCAGCESTEELVGFDLLHGGALCVACARNAAAPALSPMALALIRRILNGDLAGALGEPEGRPTTEITRLATRAMENHLERRLRSVTVLDRA
ncbi:MAG TPA: DNA repair protein RecO [Acidimicrobiales bacterium]|jgi:DNA repair protein RecO (recombination protein O)